jgi:hypothetical protein
MFAGWSRLALATTNLGIVDSVDADASVEGMQQALADLRGRLANLSEEAQHLETPAFA